jgi:hypothetical protein
MASEIGVILTGDSSNFRSMIDSSTAIVGRFDGMLKKVGAALTVGSVVGFFKTVAEKAGALQDLSDRLGVGTDALQAFDHNVKQAGGSSEQAVQAWDKGRKALDNLAIGNEAATEQFARLGLSAKSFVGLNLEQSLELIAKGYKENAGEAGAYDAITDILGSKSAPALLVALTQLGEEGFGAMIKGAREAGVVIESETIAKIDTLGDTLDKQKTKLIAAGASVLGFVIKITEGAAALAANAVNVMQGLDVVPLEQSAKKAEEAMKNVLPQIQKLTAEGAKQVEQAVQKDFAEKAMLDRSVRLNLLKQEQKDIEAFLAQSSLSQYDRGVMTVGLAEKKKLIGQEEKALNVDKEKHQERMIAATAKEIEAKRELMTFNQQMAALRQDEAGWIAVLADSTASQEVHQRAELELAKTRAKMRDVQLDKDKESVELAKLLLIPADKLTAVEKLRLDVLQGVTSQKALDEERTRLIAGLVAGTLTDAEKNRLRVLMDQAAVLGGQLETAKAITATVNRTGKGYDAQSDDNIEGVRNRLRADIQQLERDSFGQRGGVGKIGGAGKSPEQYLLESELFNIEKEIAERREVRDYNSRFGEAKTRQKFGDTLTDNALRDWTDQTAKGTAALEDIQQRLKKLFPDP